MLPAVKKCLYRVRIPVIFAMAVAAVMFIVHGRCQIGGVYQKRQFFAGPKGLADTLTVAGQAILLTPQRGLPFRNAPHIMSAMTYCAQWGVRLFGHIGVVRLCLELAVGMAVSACPRSLFLKVAPVADDLAGMRV